MTTAYVTDPRYTEHTLEGHPENAGRLYAIWQRLEDAGVLDDLAALEPMMASYNQMEAVHQRRYLEMLEMSRSGLMFLDLSDTYVLPGSFDIARIAAGGVLRAVDAVLHSEADNGIAVIRPPGHHATPQWGMGFCLLNNIAIAAQYARRVFELERVMIFDYDVHHGNGTQDIFYDDPDVLFISVHQYPYYPGTGALDETGIGAGVGATINLPLRAGVGDVGYTKSFDEIVRPAARRFAPELLLVSVGFDAHWNDPLAGMQLTLTGYTHLARRLVEVADELCHGRIVFVLEGGYNLEVLSNGVLNVCYALLGKDKIDDPLGKPLRGEPPVDALLDKVKQLHRLG
ncbi:MAG: histone deacetylase [Anaerolineae bacterium]|nr:histone deacetylase [Anaerolineae bacterium]